VVFVVVLAIALGIPLAVYLVKHRGGPGGGNRRENERITEKYRDAKGYKCEVEVTLQGTVYKAELVRTKPDTLELTMTSPAILSGLNVKTTGDGFTVTYLGLIARYDELPDNISAFVSNVMLLLQVLDGQLEAADGSRDGGVVTLAFEKPGGIKLFLKLDAASYLPLNVTVERGDALKLELHSFEFIY